MGRRGGAHVDRVAGSRDAGHALVGGGQFLIAGGSASPDQDIILRDEPRGIRRSHCRLIFRAGATHIQGRLHPDGYTLNDEHFTDCTARALKDGDSIQIGKHVTLRFSGDEE